MLSRVKLSKNVPKVTVRGVSTSHFKPAPPVQPGKPSRKTSPLVRIDGQFKTFKPITPSIRHVRFPLTEGISNNGPFKPLTLTKRKKGGRNSTGRVVSRHIGGGHKRRIRTLDFMRDQGGLYKVVRLEYDPNRSAHIALLRSVQESNQSWSYIVAPKGLKEGDTVQSFRNLSDKGISQLTAAASLGDFSGDALTHSEGQENDSNVQSESNRFYLLCIMSNFTL